MQYVEIERKWLLSGFPQGLVPEREGLAEQGYLAFSPNTVRIRRYTAAGATTRMLTIKGHGGLARAEVEVELDEGRYEALRALLACPPATKRHRVYRLPGGEALECSLVDEGEPTAFYYAEVEFASVEAANAFTPPPFLGREVTGQPGYSMAAYCLRKAQAGAQPFAAPPEGELY